MGQTIGNPLSWLAQNVGGAGTHLGESIEQVKSPTNDIPQIRRLAMQDLVQVLKLGLQDFAACRSDAMFLVFFYPLIGIALIMSAMAEQLFPLMVPMILGFAIIGPVAALGLYEMSARREAGFKPRWSDAFSVLRSTAFLSILTLSLFLAALFIAWLVAANLIYIHTLGPDQPENMRSFLTEVFTSRSGHIMALSGMFVGALFAVTAFAVSFISFPMLLDRRAGLPVAVVTSLRAVRLNFKITMIWGVVIGASLALAAIPFFVGMIIVVPVLGHATWHLYRRAVV